jgi:F-type H+-transporting ATPase subunit delta
MKWLQGVLKSNPDFLNLLRSPIIKADKKKKILAAVIANTVSEFTSAFIALLVTKNRESNLPEIITSFINLYKQNKNIHTVKLTTAIPASDAIKKAIVSQVKKSSGYENIELEEKVDENIIGGFVLQIGDKLIDASIAYDLKAIARQFENNDFIYKIR